MSSIQSFMSFSLEMAFVVGPPFKSALFAQTCHHGPQHYLAKDTRCLGPFNSKRQTQVVTSCPCFGRAEWVGRCFFHKKRMIASSSSGWITHYLTLVTEKKKKILYSQCYHISFSNFCHVENYGNHFVFSIQPTMQCA